MAEWIDQIFEISLDFGPREKRQREAVRIGLLQYAITLEVGASIPEETTWIPLEPETQEEARQLAMIFRKAARRFEEIGKGLA